MVEFALMTAVTGRFYRQARRYTASGPEVPLSCRFASVAIAQRLADFSIWARLGGANHGIVTGIGCSPS